MTSLPAMFPRRVFDDLLRYGYNLHLLDANGDPIYIYREYYDDLQGMRGYLILGRAVAPGATNVNPGYNTPFRWRSSRGVDHVTFRKLLRTSLTYYKGLLVRPHFYDEPDEHYNIWFNLEYVKDQVRLHENLIRRTNDFIENV